MCSRCRHLWERLRKSVTTLPITCPKCHSPYWNTIAKTKAKVTKIVKGKSEKRKVLQIPPLRFHGEEVLDSNIEEVLGVMSG